MNPLNDGQKELIFNYCMGLTSEKEAAEAKSLILSNKEASEIHANLKSALAPLDSIQPEPCPDDLALRTVWRLKNAANASQNRLNELLASEQSREIPYKTLNWTQWGKRLAVAAVFTVVGSILLASFTALTQYARQNSITKQCQIQQGSIFQGLSNYMADFDGRPPTVAAAEGAPWWKVGYQGSENQSNTRNVYLLVKNGYVKPNVFVCPGIKNNEVITISSDKIQTYKDFPNRNCVSFSFQITYKGTENNKLQCRKVIMSDRNPLFESLPEDYNSPMRLRLNRDLLNINSKNHKRRGQNVLFGDGRVEFLRTRHVGISEDDIFTLQDTDIYQGSEVPSRETDFFVVP
jgi:hypothetical protein